MLGRRAARLEAELELVAQAALSLLDEHRACTSAAAQHRVALERA